MFDATQELPYTWWCWCWGACTDLHGGEHEQGSSGEQQQAPHMLQVKGQAQVGDAVQQRGQKAEQQGAHAPLQPPLHTPVLQPPTP